MSNDSFTLTPAEMPALQALLSLGQLLGPGAAPMTSDSIFEMMAELDTLADEYAQITNPNVQGWSDQLYAKLAVLSTNFGIAFPGMYLAYQYAINEFAPTVDPWPLDTPMGNHENYYLTGTVPLSTSGGPTTAMVNSTGSPSPVYSTWTYEPPSVSGHANFLKGNRLGFYYIGCTLLGFVGTRQMVGVWRPGWELPTTGPAAWSGAIAAAHAKLLADMALATILMPSSPVPKVRQTMASQVLTPEKWAEVESVKHATMPVWAAQTTTVTSMLNPDTLTADGYFFMLNALAALSWGNANALQTLNRIVAAPANSTIYPNTTFGDQLVYAGLMELTDPNGIYDWNHAKLVDFVNGLCTVVTNTDPGSTALRASLVQQGRVLQSDSAFPAQDPNAPSVSFDDRLTDTLFALDKARSTLRNGSS